jgi:hypothetical protein
LATKVNNIFSLKMSRSKLVSTRRSYVLSRLPLQLVFPGVGGKSDGERESERERERERERRERERGCTMRVGVYVKRKEGGRDSCFEKKIVTFLSEGVSIEA